MSESTQPPDPSPESTGPGDEEIQPFVITMPDDPASGGDWYLWAAVLALIALVAFWPAINGTFLWDDDQYVTQNRALLDACGPEGNLENSAGDDPVLSADVHGVLDRASDLGEQFAGISGGEPAAARGGGGGAVANPSAAENSRGVGGGGDLGGASAAGRIRLLDQRMQECSQRVAGARVGAVLSGIRGTSRSGVPSDELGT